MKKRILLICAIVAAAALVCGAGLWYYLTAQQLQITLNGDGEATVEYGTAYEDPGARCIWRLGFLSFLDRQVPVTAESAVDTTKCGIYTISYSAQYGNRTAEAQRTVTVADTASPVITLTGDAEMLLDYGTEFSEPGYTAADNYDGDLTDKVTVETGENLVRYTVSDSSGNQATAQRTLRYADLSAPVLKLQGKSYVILDVGTEFSEPGYTATDVCDGDVTGNVAVSGTVDTSACGTYYLTYTVSDKAGNQATANRTVKVEEPVEVLNPIEPTGKTIYLTFDDGPGPYTAKLLDVLSKYNAKATFFIVGNKGYHDLIRRMDSEGHAVAVHTYCHKYDEIYQSTAAYWADFEKTQNLIYELTGKRTTMFRFPGGGSNTVSRKYCRGIMTDLARDAAEMGYTYFDWNVSSGDAGGTKSTQGVYRNVINGIGEKNYAIVLQHDTQSFSVNAVEQILIWGLNRGYTFAALEPTSPTAHHAIAN